MKQSKPLPLEVRMDALQDRVHADTGRLLAAKAIGTRAKGTRYQAPLAP